jgi:hypothetical protein
LEIARVTDVFLFPANIQFVRLSVFVSLPFGLLFNYRPDVPAVRLLCQWTPQFVRLEAAV